MDGWIDSLVSWLTNRLNGWQKDGLIDKLNVGLTHVLMGGCINCEVIQMEGWIYRVTREEGNVIVKGTGHGKGF